MNIEELKRLAEAATPGPWEYQQLGQSIYAESVGGCRLEKSKFMLADIRGWGHLQYIPDGAAKQDANGAYIAATSPDVVLSLISQIERLKAEAELFAKHVGLVIARKDALLRCIYDNTTMADWPADIEERIEKELGL